MTLAKRTVAVVINCAGNGTRFRKNKLMQSLGGKPVIVRTIENFLLPEIDEIIVTVNAKYEKAYRQLLIEKHQLPIKLVLGGRERYESTLNGLRGTGAEFVLIHDGVRPFVSPDEIARLLEMIKAGSKAAILAIPTITTIKEIDPRSMEIQTSLSREKTWLAQTPQLFDRELLLSCYQKAAAENYQVISDDSEIVSRFSQEKVKVVRGTEMNMKITYPEDMVVARGLFKKNIKLEKPSQK